MDVCCRIGIIETGIFKQPPLLFSNIFQGNSTMNGLSRILISVPVTAVKLPCTNLEECNEQPELPEILYINLHQSPMHSELGLM